MSGPSPTPTALRLLRGNPGKRPLNDREPKPKRGLPAMPAHVKADDEARREWQRMGKRLLALGLLTEIDRAAMAAYCVAWSRWVKAEEIVREWGLLVSGPHGSHARNPALKVAADAMALMLRVLPQFGMTPSSRSRLHVDAAQEEDSFDQFLGRGA